MPKLKKKVLIPRIIIPQTPMFMRKGSRKKSILTLCTSGVFAGTKTVGYPLDSYEELDRIITEASDPELRVALVNLALPPVSHVFIIIKLAYELRVYDVQNHYAVGGEVLSHYEDFSNDPYDCTGYRYFLNGLIERLHMTTGQLRFMPSPELSKETWEVIDYCAETGERLDGEVRGPCLLWCDAILNRHWMKLLDEAYPDQPDVIELPDDFPDRREVIDLTDD